MIVRVHDTLQRDRARRLRRESAAAEARLWECLRARRLDGWKWRRQVPIGPYIVDFYCPDADLIVELDGGQHSEAIAYDTRRTAYVEAHGLGVLRFWNSQVLPDPGGVYFTILDALNSSPPTRSARGEAG